MMITKRLPVLLAGLLLLAACGVSLPDQPQPQVETPAEIPAETPALDAATVPTAAPADGATTTDTPAETPAAVAVSDPASACPAATEGTALYVSRENGFCFLYPSDLQLRPDSRFPQDAVQLVGAPLDPNAMESIALNLGVTYNGLADGLDSAGYAAAWLVRNVESLELPQTPVTIGGYDAVMVEDVPGYSNQRAAVLVANDAKYQLTLLPQPQDVPELAEAATEAWDTVTQSMVFFAPQRTDTVVRAADVCPQAMADTELLIDEVGGYCFLYPTGFAVDTFNPVTLVGGPELGPFGDFHSLRASLTVGGAYPLADMTPEQVLQPGPENNDLNSVVDTTLAGYPAVTYDFVVGPWRQRNAAVVVDDRYYTFVIQPWDPDLFPQALPDVERLWNTVSQSIAFFEPWR